MAIIINKQKEGIEIDLDKFRNREQQERYNVDRPYVYKDSVWRSSKETRANDPKLEERLRTCYDYIAMLDEQQKIDRDRITMLDEQQKIDRDRITALEAQSASSTEISQTWLDELLKQNEISRKELRFVFDIDPNDKIDTSELDGMLKDCTDEKENSMELVRSARGG